jgi:AcrR family transcriptional regulator
MSPRPHNDERHPDLQTGIKEAAWQQIAEQGAASLNLRAIARTLGIAAPSIYNYFPNRDALVTTLIADAYNSLADAQESVTAADPAERVSTLGLAYRQWAVTYPQRYLLIFGTPIPNYHAPEDVTLPAATRALVPLIEALQALFAADRLRVDSEAAPSPRLESMLKTWQESVGGVHPQALYLALVVWSRVHGLVMLEITNQIPSMIDEPGEVFRREIQTFLIQYIQEKP